MGILKKRVNEFPTPYTCTRAIREGGLETKLSMVLMGFGNMVHGQRIKGLLYLAIEVAYVVFMIVNGIGFLGMLPSLGSVPQEEYWDEAAQVYMYTKGDQSILILLYGVATVLLTVLMFLAWRGALRSAYKAECLAKEGRHVNNFAEDLKTLLHENLHRLLMTPPVFFIFAFTVLPLVFMICMAFTNYSKIDNHLMLFDWVGLENFKALFDSSSILGSTFWSVLGWTLIWAFFATFSNYIFGMIISLLINRKGTRAKGFWRFCFVLSCAVPMFVSLLIMRTMLQPEGAINVLLRNLGLIASDASLPFFTDPTWARVTVIIVNVWVGVPYTLLQLTGVLQNIPEELYEAARVDGANAVQIFFKITLPYMLYVTTPYLITTFTGNVNNFNVIYLLSGGDPVTDLASTAGDGLDQVTWMDVRVGEILPTPRHGKPVEVNAYWYNALRIMAEFSRKRDGDGTGYGTLAEKVKKSFTEAFWMEEKHCLKDVISGTDADMQIRCNQIWAVSMPFTMLDPEREQQVVDTVFEKLYTPYGLRTLSQDDPQFRPSYGGEVLERDLAYHQGTVWVYPLGAYYLARLKVNGDSEETKEEVKAHLEVMESALREGCIGQLPEIYDGENPVSSKGCFAQAWSVGEILRVYERLEKVSE